jgi:hypothetical protein
MSWKGRGHRRPEHGVSLEIEPANYIQARDVLSTRRGIARVREREATPLYLPQFCIADILEDFE